VIDRPLETRSPRPLRLRTLTPDDAPAFARHAAADIEHLREHLPWADPAKDPDGAAAWLDRYARGEDGRVLVAGAFDGDEIVGGALLAHHSADTATVHIGCWATTAVHGLGVARGACAALIEHARTALRVERYDLDVLSLVGAELDAYVGP
jgi:RimJ/RimL family protein N-acetyltransferase